MPDKVTPGPLCGNPPLREAVCVHTRKIYDSCREKECLQDLPVYLTCSSQAILENAVNVKARSAELLWTYINVEPITYNRGFYTVDVRYFYKLTFDAFCGVGRPKTLSGLAVYDKRTILFGSEGSARIFTSEVKVDRPDLAYPSKTNHPIAVVEAVDPLVLDARIVDSGSCCKRECDCDLCEVPDCVSSCFGGELSSGDDNRRIYVTLGQFSIVRLERDTQLLIPVYDYCLPDKDCSCGAGGSHEDPCGIFRNISFPVNEFFPPNTVRIPDNYEDTKAYCSCCK